MKTNKTRKTYGLFYKSQGKWTGPYLNRLLTQTEATRILPNAREVLKSKVSVRKVSFV